MSDLPQLIEKYPDRPSWDDYFLKLCEDAALRSVDEDTKVGCVIVNQRRRIVSTGYNSFPAGVDDSFWPRRKGQTARVPKVGHPRFSLVLGPPRFEKTEGPPGTNAFAAVQQATLFFGTLTDDDSYEVDKYMAMTHAELNAVVAAGRDLSGCTLYSVLHPCHECAKAVITSGIKRVVYRQTREEVSWAVAKLLFTQAGVECVEVKKE
jgi:dCMP deaminase